MKRCSIVFFLCGFFLNATVFGAELAIPFPVSDAPVIHSGRYHVLSVGRTSVVLDGARGMSICFIAHRADPGRYVDTKNAVLVYGGLTAKMTTGGKIIELDQANDPAARLQIMDQGPGRAAARAYFAMNTRDGIPYGSGTLDFYIYDDRVHLAPSLHLDYAGNETVINEAGFGASVPGSTGELIRNGSKLVPKENNRFDPFGGDREGFEVALDNPGRDSAKIGWRRNTSPAWLYLNEIDNNPETEELYEKWPAWITQRGGPPSWNKNSRSGMYSRFSAGGVERLDFRWISGDSLKIAQNGWTPFNGMVAVFFGSNAPRTAQLWSDHVKPKSPVVKGGEFKYYNEIEGVYEIDSQGGDVTVSFDGVSEIADRTAYVRFWNLSGKGACEIKVNGKPIPFGLYNTGDIIEDPIVPMLKNPTGPARFAGAAVAVSKNAATVLTLTRKPGIQLAYQMYSALETCEAWSDACAESPLFKLHLCTGEIYEATLPGKRDYAFIKLPIYWVKNGVNNNTFMNNTRGFSVLENGPDRIRFAYTGVNLEGSGLSTYTVTAPFDKSRLVFDIKAEFSPLDDGKRWSSVEYCDLYPFDNVFRRTFHYRDVIYLDKTGKFDRVGTGAWSGKFEKVAEPDQPGYYSKFVKRPPGISRTPNADDGSVWLLANNPERGNILYRRGVWIPSLGASSTFSLCNAWVDVHNTVGGRSDPASKETISFTVEVFPGAVPSVEELTALYVKDAGGAAVKQVDGVRYSAEGVIEGFEVKK